MWVVFIIALMGRKLFYDYRGNMVISPGVALSVSLILVFILCVKFIGLAYTLVFLPSLTNHVEGLGSSICSC